MKPSGEESSTPPTTPKKDRLTVSPRKLAANRKNALKSTGPKTERGKAFSQRNSWKHGLFARQFWDFIAHGEDPDEYSELLEGLRKQFHPCGRAEELEVERIAQSSWRMKRAHRYENAVNRVAQRDIARRELTEQEEQCRQLEKEEKATVQLLEDAMDKIWAAGEIPQELKEKVSAVMPRSKDFWADFERLAGEFVDRILPKINSKLKRQDCAPFTALLTAKIAIQQFKGLAATRIASAHEIAVAQHVIPNSDALDRMLRYETSIERSLNRALERLERMQGARRGENNAHLPK